MFRGILACILHPDHVPDDLLLHQSNQPGQTEPVGQSKEVQAVGGDHRRVHLISVQVDEELVEAALAHAREVNLKKN